MHIKSNHLEYEGSFCGSGRATGAISESAEDKQSPIAGYGVLGTPAVVVDGELKSVGKIPLKNEVKSWVEQ